MIQSYINMSFLDIYSAPHLEMESCLDRSCQSVIFDGSAGRRSYLSLSLSLSGKINIPLTQGIKHRLNL